MNQFWHMITMGCGMWGVAAIVGIVLLAALMSGAPEGYEDDSGFHRGRP